jgi:Ca2+-transporting ATPase
MQLSDLPHVSDWKDLVKESDHSKVAEVMDLVKDVIGNTSQVIDDQPILPPQGILYWFSWLHQYEALTSLILALYFDRKPEALLQMFNVSISEGLQLEQVEELKKHYGTNELPPPPKHSLLKMLWAQLTDFMVVFLMVAAVISYFDEEDERKVTFISLVVVIVLNVIIGLTQGEINMSVYLFQNINILLEYKANKSLEALSSLSVPKAKVIRGSVQMEIDSSDLVPGDIVVLDEGDAVPADLRLVEVAQLEVVESVLTGESVSVAKNEAAIKAKSRKLPLGDCKGNAFMTTVITRGRAYGVVVRTGKHTEVCKHLIALPL